MRRLILYVVLYLVSTNVQSQDSATVTKLHSFITDWWRTPYRYGGNSTRGIDCSAFAQKLYSEVYNISLPRTAAQQYKISHKITKDDLQDGDLVFFRTRTKSGWHVGVYIAGGFFVHSGSGRGVFINSLNEPRYKKIYYGAGRFTKKALKLQEQLLL